MKGISTNMQNQQSTRICDAVELRQQPTTNNIFYPSLSVDPYSLQKRFLIVGTVFSVVVCLCGN